MKYQKFTSNLRPVANVEVAVDEDARTLNAICGKAPGSSLEKRMDHKAMIVALLRERFPGYNINIHYQT